MLFFCRLLWDVHAELLRMIQSVNYFVVGYTMIQTCSPSHLS